MPFSSTVILIWLVIKPFHVAAQVMFFFTNSEVELRLGLASSSGGDDWSGRVLDIVRRINQHSTEKANEMKSELAAAKEGEKQFRLELAAIKDELKREMTLRVTEMMEITKVEIGAIKELLRRD